MVHSIIRTLDTKGDKKLSCPVDRFRGRSLIWDSTCVDTLAPSHLLNTSRRAASAAELAVKKKVNKYAHLLDNYIFVPFAVETFSPWSHDAKVLVSQISKILISITGDRRCSTYLRQHLSIAIQRGNAMSVLGTLPESSPLDELIISILKLLQSRAVASRSKASRLGLALRNARWFESSWGKKFSHEISASVWDRCPPSIYEYNIGRGDKVSKLRAQVEDVKQVMLENVEKVMERGERLDDLLSKTEDLESHVSITQQFLFFC
ncbi:hypothetical protein ANN_14194 [Periplaneta americana]|uniref:Vesicle-associated membrane protein 7 n=1 Tax=Periplaneta americana TaxID=6978 RepID=A0ABQ8SXS7_PERAM|nr:hypothetical protein ANN_14194 [Periplaneta americana]